MIQNIPEFSLVGEASSAEEAIADFSFKKIDILISDMVLPGQNGLVIFEKIKAVQPHVKVVFLTMMKDWDLVKKAYLLGADGYILKDSDSEYIEVSIKEIIAGKKIFPDGMISILPLGSEWEGTSAKLQDLSKRENSQQINHLILTHQVSVGSLTVSASPASSCAVSFVSSHYWKIGRRGLINEMFGIER